MYPADGSPKKIGPPEAAAPGECVVTKPGEVEETEVGDVVWARGEGDVAPAVAVPRGSVSKERVRMHEARTMEKEEGTTGSCVEV